MIGSPGMKVIGVNWNIADLMTSTAGFVNAPQPIKTRTVLQQNRQRQPRRQLASISDVPPVLIKTNTLDSSMQHRTFCFKCEGDHRLKDCYQFKELSIRERVTFCVRHRSFCFFCFSSRHSVQNCAIKKSCKQKDYHYSHNELLQDFSKLPMTKMKLVDNEYDASWN